MAEAVRVPNELLRNMLADVRLTPAEVEVRFEQATDEAYWSQLCPMLTVHTSAPIETNGGGLRSNLVASIAENGWLKTEPFFSRDVTARVVAAVEALVKAGWPPVFVFLFDDVWQIVRHPAIQRLLSEVLGGELVQLPFIWCHHVAARNGASGWPPHADKAEDKGGALTLWIALTDATLDNGCMAFLPRGAIHQDVERRFLSAEPLTSGEVLTLVQSGHPVPAETGSLLVWDDSTIHWGGRCVNPVKPRMSLATSFARKPTDPALMPRSWEGSTDATAPTSFRGRLRAIGSALRRYWTSEPLTSRWEPLAIRLINLPKHHIEIGQAPR